MKAKITKRLIDGLLADTVTPAVVWDDAVTGFCVRRRSSGFVYCVKYRAGSGRAAPIRWATIGKHGAPWTVEMARAEAKRILAAVAMGSDPAAQKAADKAAPRLADLAQRFLAEHAAAKRKASTAAEYRRLVTLFILPALGKRKVSDVTRADIAKLHHGLRATPYQANRVLAVASKMFGLAEVWGMRPDGSNPCRHVEKFKEAKRERMLSVDELARLGDALAVWQGSPYVTAALRLLVLTGARLSEVLTMQWAWVDFERAEVRLPDSKTGAKTLHLPAAALAILADLPRVANNPYVICGERQGQHWVNLQKPWRAIRAAAGLPDLRIHDLRHGFASVAASSGMGLPIIGKLLGHSQPATTHRYAHLAADPVKAAAETVGKRIAEAMTNAAKATVVPLTAAKG